MQGSKEGERGDSEGNIGFGGVLSSGRGGVTNGKRGPEHVCASPVQHIMCFIIGNAISFQSVIGLMIKVVRFPK